MDYIELVGKAISPSVDKNDLTFQAIIGKTPFTPELVIDESSDFNCGGLCNELEMLRVTTEQQTKALLINNAGGINPFRRPALLRNITGKRCPGILRQIGLRFRSGRCECGQRDRS